MIIAYQIQMILGRQFFVTISGRTIAPYWLHGKLHLLQELSLLLIPKQDGTIHQKNCKHIIIIFKYWVKKVTNIRIIGKKKNRFPTCSQPGLQKAYEGIYQYWTPWTIPKESQPNPYKLEQERILESTNEKSTKILST